MRTNPTAVEFRMYVDWQDLLDWDIERMNDEAQAQYDRIDSDGNRNPAGLISDISYSLVDRNGDQLVFEVSCLVEDVE